MEQLKVQVERIVRPIRASATRKNKMRNELLAHLMEKTEALTAQGMDESAASAQAIEQLGDPAALRADLQASVPALERLACLPLPTVPVFDNYFEKADGETAFFFAFTRSVFVGVFMGFILLLLVGAQWLGLLPACRPRHGDPQWWRAIVVSLTWFWSWASYFISLYLAAITGFRRLMSKSAPYPAWTKGGSLCLFLLAQLALMICPLVFALIMLNPADAEILKAVFMGPEGRFLYVGLFAILVVLFPIVSIGMKFEHQQWMKWGSLRIDD